MRYIHGASRGLKVAVESQLLCDSEHVDRLLAHAELLYGRIDFLVCGIIKAFRFYDVTYRCVGIAFEHDRTEYSLLKIGVARDHASVDIGHRSVARLFVSRCAVALELFGHK